MSGCTGSGPQCLAQTYYTRRWGSECCFQWRDWPEGTLSGPTRFGVGWRPLCIRSNPLEQWNLNLNNKRCNAKSYLRYFNQIVYFIIWCLKHATISKDQTNLLSKNTTIKNNMLTSRSVILCWPSTNRGGWPLFSCPIKIICWWPHLSPSTQTSIKITCNSCKYKRTPDEKKYTFFVFQITNNESLNLIKSFKVWL